MDIIEAVMQRADPGKSMAAARRLESFSRLAVAGAGSPKLPKFAALKDQSRLPESESADDPKVKAAMHKLEAMLAAKMVEAAMPKDQSHIYGEGVAGDVWRGLQIEAMGAAIADGGLLSVTGGASQARRPIVPFAG